MRFDYTELRKLIKAKYKSIDRFCAIIKMTPVTLDFKLYRGVDFSQQQIVNIVKALDLDMWTTARCFFTPAKDNIECKELKELIKSVYGTVKAFAKEIQVNESFLTRKLNGVMNFKPHEVEKYRKALGIKSEDIDKYFFPEIEKANKRKESKNGHNN